MGAVVLDDAEGFLEVFCCCGLGNLGHLVTSAAFDAAMVGPAMTLGVVESLAAVALGSVLRLVGLLHLDREAAESFHLEDAGLLAHGQLGADEEHRTVTAVHSTDLNGLETQVHQVVEHLLAGNAYGDATDDDAGGFFLRGVKV